VVLAIDSFHESTEMISARLQEHLNNANERIHRSYQLSFCLGMTRFNVNSSMTIDDLMAKADAALYEEKRARTNLDLVGSSVQRMELVSQHQGASTLTRHGWQS